MVICWSQYAEYVVIIAYSNSISILSLIAAFSSNKSPVYQKKGSGNGAIWTGGCGGVSAVWDASADWSEAKAEIDANRPVASSVPGHVRACFGWKRSNLSVIGTTPARWLYILDPWPWNSDICMGGAVYWEDWNAIPVADRGFIYLRHRSTSCT